MRSIRQPGRPAPERIQWAEARGRAFSFVLEAGLPLLEATRRGFAAAGFAGGVLNIKGGALGPFAYVMPALSRTGENAAFYSDTETAVAEPFEVEAFGIVGAVFRAEPDPETKFKLFGPVPSAAKGAEATCRVYALRLRPNQDFAAALEAFCREQGIAHAKLHGGVGSIIGARFADGRIVEPFATEMAVSSGVIVSGEDGALQATLDVALVDYLGGIGVGRLTRGDNPVLMTMELVLEELTP